MEEDELEEFFGELGDVVRVGRSDGIVCGVFWANPRSGLSSSHDCREPDGKRIDGEAVGLCMYFSV